MCSVPSSLLQLKYIIDLLIYQGPLVKSITALAALDVIGEWRGL